jgi:transcriptional regulator with XRE-family HTH domain
LNKSAALLKYKRHSKKMTQSQLAEICGCSPQFVCNWENERCIIPGPMVTPVCKALKINKRILINYILEDIKMIFYRNV